MRIIGATGHRPKTLGGFYPQVQARLNRLARMYLERERPDKVVSGMALGWDTAFANIALQLNIPFIAAIPFPQQADIWPPAQKEMWEYLRSKAEREIVSYDRFSMHAFHKRNETIVDESTEIAALWNGNSGSGTAHCISCARRRGLAVINLYSEYAALADA
jgi:uncharacterized phage-like protein YoqJ